MFMTKVARGPEKCLNSGIKYTDAGSRQEELIRVENKYSTEVHKSNLAVYCKRIYRGDDLISSYLYNLAYD